MTTHIPVRRMQVTFRPRAVCVEEECGWTRDPGPSTNDIAKDHVRFTGHVVEVIREEVSTWGPKR